MKENYEMVQRGFRVLHPLMAGYIGREMNRVYHDRWWQEVLEALKDQEDLPYKGSYNELIDSLDIANCLRLIDRKWKPVFKEKLGVNFRTWSKELMGVRNTVSHIGQKDLNKPDAERALDTMTRLCSGFDSEGANEIKEIYNQVRLSGKDGIQIAINSEGPSPIDIPLENTQKVAFNHVDNLLDLIGTDVVQKTTLTRKVTFDGNTQAYPVYKVRLDALYYNDQNDRIATWITRYRAENGKDALEKLSGLDYNNIIESFVYESNPEALQKTQRNIALVGQREPGVTLADGRIVDGNRRYTCLRRLERDNKESIYFETVIMDVDAQKDKKQIKLLELAIQHGEEKKVDYDLIDYAIGTYMDVEKTKLLTIDEYAASTNETITEVRKRIDIAIIICDFLEYINLPEQYHVARDYQVYSLFQEMMPALKQLNSIEKQQLKIIAFNNILMIAVPDQRKFIRDIKLLIKSGTYTMYFNDQIELNKQIHEKYDKVNIVSKEDIEKFAQINEDLSEKLQLSLQKALLRSRRQKLIIMPSENIEKSLGLIKSIDARMFDKMDESEKEKLKNLMLKLVEIVEFYIDKL